MPKRKVESGDEIKIAQFANPVPMSVSLAGQPSSKHDWIERSAIDHVGLFSALTASGVPADRVLVWCKNTTGHTASSGAVPSVAGDTSPSNH